MIFVFFVSSFPVYIWFWYLCALVLNCKVLFKILVSLDTDIDLLSP